MHGTCIHEGTDRENSVKHIAKSRRSRLAGAVASFASSLRRTVAGRAAGHGRAQLSRTGTHTIRPSTVAARLSLVPAHAGHLEWMARILREGAADGSFDAELATDSLAAQVFFANLRRALEMGYLLTDGGDAPPSQTAASGYVYTLPSASRGAIPIGFTLFKSIGGLGFEVWLVGVDRRFRGKGFGKAMLQAVLATPAGMLAHVARVNRAGHDCVAMGKALGAAGYRPERDGPDVRWFVRQDAPQALVRLVREGGVRLS